MKERINPANIPQHVAVIMDGNGRWAKKKGAKRVFGHQNAIKAVHDTTEGCAELGVKYLTLYAFSTENWSRPQLEVSALMQLLVNTIRKETKTLMDNNIKLASIGEISRLPDSCQKELAEAKEITKNNNGMTLVLALSYSGRSELALSVKELAKAVKAGTLDTEEITESTIASYLNTQNMPDPELLIRTSGEMRISNFLLWQIAYTELYFTEVLWPDFRKEHLHQAIIDFQSRERRFGKISEQLSGETNL